MRHSWKRKRAQASHTDDWLMTYADMITLLLCFFAIFLSVSIPRKDAMQKVEIIQRPDVLEGNLPLYGRAHADRPTEYASVNVPVEPAAKPPAPAPEIVERAAVPAVPPPENTAAEIPPAPVVAPPPVLPPEAAELPAKPATEPAARPSATLHEIVDRLKAGGPADIEQKGDRITTLQMNSAAFFASGSAALSESGKSILQDVAVNLKSDKFRDYQVTVEGHTDDQPISTPQFPSNWELSTARAAAVVHFFLDQGIPAQKLRAAGYADTFPVAPNRDANGKPIPANQARNRRVVIKLEKIDKAE